MEVEFKSPPIEPTQVALVEVNGKDSENSDDTKSESPTIEAIEKRTTRSRSSTPQKKKNEEDKKKLSHALKRIDKELNGNELVEEMCETGSMKKDNEPKVNGDEKDKEQKVDDDEKDKEQKVNGDEHKQKAIINGTTEKEADLKMNDVAECKENVSAESTSTEKEIEMDPLVVTDEPDPELQFDDTSDVESGKNSPVLSRCKTRRSQTRNIPTPKTPKAVDDDSDKNSAVPTPELPESEVDSPKKLFEKTLNDWDDSSTDNASTKAEVGSDATRLDYVANDSGLRGESPFLSASRDRSVTETLRCLSARRPIRPINDDYLKKTLRRNHEKSDLNIPYPMRRSVGSVSTGIKRKSRSETPEDHNKKIKSDSPGLTSIFSSPLSNIRNKFHRADLPSSTPKLVSYKDKSYTLDSSEFNSYNEDLSDNGVSEKKWCSIM